MLKKKVKRRLTLMVDFLDISTRGLKEYFQKSKEILIIPAINSNSNIRTNRKKEKITF